MVYSSVCGAYALGFLTLGQPIIIENIGGAGGTKYGRSSRYTHGAQVSSRQFNTQLWIFSRHAATQIESSP